MGLKQLSIVGLKEPLSGDAEKMAMNARDVLGQSHKVDFLDEAIRDSSLIIGASARSRSFSLPTLTPWDAAQLVIDTLQTDHRQISLLFGRESKGLSNAELSYCTHQVFIPSDPDCPSLNLAQDSKRDSRGHSE